MILFLLFLSFLIVTVTIFLCQILAPNKNGESQIRSTLVIAAVVFGGMWVWYFFSYNSDDSKAARVADDLAKKCSDASMAYIMSQKFVKQHLKSPSTADFPIGISKYSTAIGDCKFSISSYVDSQNSFGAIVRSRYVAIMEYLPKENGWRAIALEIK